MTVSVTSELVEIAKAIIAENKTLEQWKEAESSDMFQNGNYSGGFDATEMQFTFSVYQDNREFWFQLSLGDVHDLAEGLLTTVDVRSAE